MGRVRCLALTQIPAVIVTCVQQEKMMNRGINFGIFLAALLMVVISATPLADPALMEEALNSTLTEEQDQGMNETEVQESSGSGNSSGEPVDCTCNLFDCSNCGWVTNLLPNATTPMAIINLYSSTDETADYLRKYFCKMYALETILRDNMYDVSKTLTIIITIS